MTNVLVTGGAGFIGSHVAELLVREGYNVVVLDNLSQGKRAWVPKGAALIEGDILDRDLLTRLCADMDGVFHLAAMSRVLPSLDGGPAAALYSAEQNITGTLNVMVAAAEAGVKKLVYSASSTFYGNSEPPHHEDAYPACHTPYGISKYVGELYAGQFERMYGLPCVCLRYFQVYGPRCPKTGPYAMVSAIFIEQAMKGEFLTVHGDGSQRRDFVHVRDVAEANMRAFESDVHGEVINIGTGVSHSIKELADMISPNQINLPNRKFDMRETLADTSKCARFLNWTPGITFEDGTRELIAETVKCE